MVQLIPSRKQDRKCKCAVAWDFQQYGMCDQQSLRSACAYAQSDQSLCLSLEYSMIVKLLTEHDLKFLSLKGGCIGSSESTHIKMPHCWKSRHSSNILTCDRHSYPDYHMWVVHWLYRNSQTWPSSDANVKFN